MLASLTIELSTIGLFYSHVIVIKSHNLFMFISCFFATNIYMIRLMSTPSCMTCRIVFTVSKIMFIQFVM